MSIIDRGRGKRGFLMDTVVNSYTRIALGNCDYTVTIVQITGCVQILKGESFAVLSFRASARHSSHSEFN